MTRIITKRQLCEMFNLDPDDCDYVSLVFEVDKGGEHGRATCAIITDTHFAADGAPWGQIKSLKAGQ